MNRFVRYSLVSSANFARKCSRYALCSAMPVRGWSPCSYRGSGGGASLAVGTKEAGEDDGCGFTLALRCSISLPTW